MDLAGRRVLVTGASRNLGTTICERFADAGMSVALNYHSTREPAEELAAALRERTGTRHAAVAGDVTDAGSVRSMVASAVAELGGPIDVLINNAGPFGMTPFVDMDETEWDSVWDANVKASYLVTREVAPGMRAAGWGRIINMSAVSAWVRNRSIYGLAKAAIITLTEELAVELAPEITVNAIAPGQILESLDDLGEFSREWAEKVTARTPAGRLVTRSELAEMAYLLCTPAFDMVTGMTIPVDGGLRLPRF
jgi:NAD(P)-dependent dehydrogenase (short-subunit alcohol dehydrogenase family)